MISEDRVLVQHNLLKELNKFIGQISRHERLHRHRDILRILRLTESSLDHLVDERSAVRVLLLKDVGPQVRVATSDKITSLTLEQGVLIADLLLRQQYLIVELTFIGEICSCPITVSK